MKHASLLLTVCICLSTLISHAQNSISFTPNKGQWEEDFLYKCSTPDADFYLEKNGYTVLLSDAENNFKMHDYKHGTTTAAQTLKYHAYKMRWLGANTSVKTIGSKPEKFYYNFYLGNEPSRWKSNIHPFKKTKYLEIYDGIDVEITAVNNQLKYDYIVQPSADPSILKLQYTGLDKVSIKNGKLHLATSLGEIVEKEPYSFQETEEGRKEVACEYFDLGNNTIGFRFPNGYNQDLPLTIDPTITFSTLTGSIADNWGFTATYDKDGHFYAGGISAGQGYPTTSGAFQSTFGGPDQGIPGDITITKFNAVGNALIFSTYLGGTGVEFPHSLIVNKDGELIVAGRTTSPNFPTTANAFDNTLNGGADLYISKFSTTGNSLVASTYIGGSADDGASMDGDFSESQGTLKHNYGDNFRTEVMIDKNQDIILAANTKSSNFPITSNAVKTSISGPQDGLLIKINSDLSNLMYSTYIGGSNHDAAYAIALDNNNDFIYVGGGTMSSDFMAGHSNSALNPSYKGGPVDGFITKFQNEAPYTLIRNTFIGTNQYDQVFGLQTDSDDNVYAVGQSQGAFPVQNVAYSIPNAKQFIISLNADLTSSNFSTTWGAPNSPYCDVVPVAFLVDTCKRLYISGWGGDVANVNGHTLENLPISPDAFNSNSGDKKNFYFMCLNENSSNLLFGSYYGSADAAEHVDGGTSRFNPNGEIYQAICASCGNNGTYPATAGSWATVKGSSNCNLGALKIAFNLGSVSTAVEATPNSVGCAPFTVSFNNQSTNATQFDWNFGDGTANSSEMNPTHTFQNPGTYTVKLIAQNPLACKTIDSTTLTIVVASDSLFPSFSHQVIDTCDNYTVSFTNTSTSTANINDANYTWIFGDGSPNFIGTNPPDHNYPNHGTYTVKLIMTDTNACNSPDTITKEIFINIGNVIAAFNAADSCTQDNLINFVNTSTNGTSYIWDFGDGNTSTAVTPSHTYASLGSYTVQLKAFNGNSCNISDSLSKTINFYPKPIASYNYTPDPTEVNKPINFINTTTGAQQYSWTFGDGNTSTEKNPSHLYEMTGNYDVCLYVTNDQGCTDTICKNIYSEIRPLAELPSGFSPNGDGQNDIFKVRGYAIKSIQLQIFNRWGELVFESNNKDIGWDGTYKGTPQPMETYAYLLKVDFFDGSSTTQKGNVTLLR